MRRPNFGWRTGVFENCSRDGVIRLAATKTSSDVYVAPRAFYRAENDYSKHCFCTLASYTELDLVEPNPLEDKGGLEPVEPYGGYAPAYTIHVQCAFYYAECIFQK